MSAIMGARLKFGDRFVSKRGLWFWVVDYKNALEVLIEFDITKYRQVTAATSIRVGHVRDRLTSSVHGVGYLGVGGHPVVVGGSTTRAYRRWASMLQRCYDSKVHLTQPSYLGCQVCEEWHNFQNFAGWFVEDYREGLQLDKDILGDGKLYSPETCKFVTQRENSAYATAKRSVVTSPAGEQVSVYNMQEFCRLEGLDPAHMSAVVSGSRKSHKGWKAKTESMGDGYGQ